jgi:hypothetical protein
MPIRPPALDARSFEQLRDEVLSRIPMHNPEWTNFNASDPGVTLLELFAFLTESLLYRANQIPERNRLKFLQLLGVPLAPAQAATGIVQLGNARGPLAVAGLAGGTAFSAGAVPFVLEQGLDVLPLEAHVCVKRERHDVPDELRDYYDQLYASFERVRSARQARLYETVPLQATVSAGGGGVDLASDTLDGALWIALAARKGDDPDRVRDTVGGRVLSLGLVPWLADADRVLRPGGVADAARPTLRCQAPLVPPDGRLPAVESERVPQWRTLPLVPGAGGDVLLHPGTLQLTLPDAASLRLWSNLDPLEAGVGDFPPTLEDSAFEGRILTWLKLTLPPGSSARWRWAGINAGLVVQRERILAERLPDGDGTPQQQRRLARSPVLAGSVALSVTPAGAAAAQGWQAIDDLWAAAPEGAGSSAAARVFRLDAEAGELQFGDGAHGERPPLGARLAVSYDVSAGRAGNVNAGAIDGGPLLPPGFTVSNPVPTWGGADAESVADGEKQVSRFLQHRDRCVNAADFEAIAWRAPGLEIGRIDVVSASSPEFGPNEPGDAPGAVTLLVLPRRDTAQPDAPRPDRLFLDTLCAWLEPRRLVTTEVFLRGADYVPVWISVGVDVEGGRSIAEVVRAVDAALRTALAVLPPTGQGGVPAELALFSPPAGAPPRGWPLRKEVVALELAAVAARVAGVSAVRELQLAGVADTVAQTRIPMRGLQLPRVAGLSVVAGDALPVIGLRGDSGRGDDGAADRAMPVPLIPEHC